MDKIRSIFSGIRITFVLSDEQLANAIKYRPLRHACIMSGSISEFKSLGMKTKKKEKSYMATYILGLQKLDTNVSKPSSAFGLWLKNERTCDDF